MISMSATKSTSNWLDRLRSSRGFPAGETPDLDGFLSTSSSGSAPTADSTHSEWTQCQAAVRNRSESSTGDSWLGEVSNVLFELFNMGECSRSFPRKKSSRKQANPRFCGNNAGENELCTSDDWRREKSDNGLVSSGDNSLNERRESTAAADHGSRFVQEGDNVDLKDYSRNEVVVIDTSLPEWKFDGWVFRKNDEWKIKEKKSKSRVFGGRKRKVLVSTLVDEKLDEGHQQNRNNQDEESFLPLNKGQPQNGKDVEPLKETADFIGKSPKKRFLCPRPPNKFINGGSSPVALSKSIPVSNTSK